MNRPLSRWWLVFIVALSTSACEQRAERAAPPSATDHRAVATIPPPELSLQFLTRATQALAMHLRPETKVLELRISGTSFSLQSKSPEVPSRIQQTDYVEYAEGGVRKSKIYGPSPVEVRGEGELESNLFAFEEIDLKKMAGAFPIAKLAVDPDEGEVEKMIVRRFLPFSSHVRARIFVRSPRIEGSIDTNEEGTPLKR